MVSFSLFKKDVFILFLAVVSLSCCTWAFSSCSERGQAGAVVVVHGLLAAVASLLWSTGSRVLGLQKLELPGSRAQAQQWWCTGLIVPRHVGSSQPRDGTCVSCVGRQIPYH